ncbi:MAG TPA: class III cytochrome C family protein [Ignavibacteria bacterium]|nr:class III cytochrome C family protein [Ignavibacteria bacterium]HMQ97462.1 class III cytochrome C family protein [Ignavibacteria bacterium]
MNKVYVILITIVIIGLMYVYPNMMLNPGELTNNHQQIASDCFACHKPFWGISNEKCITCHNISEIGAKRQDSVKMKKILFHKNLIHQECSACHTDHNGLNPQNSTVRFSHELISENVISNCAGCHEIPSDSKHAKFKSECKGCHVTGKWSDIQNFKHELVLGNEINNCSSCHKIPDDDLHTGMTENCNFCHSTSKWKPSTFDHSSGFILDSDHNTKCITCHTGNQYKVYTCYGCHEHTPGNIADEHNEEGITNFEDCVSCHKSANEHDIKNGNDRNDKKEKNDKEEKRNKNRNNDSEDDD